MLYLQNDHRQSLAAFIDAGYPDETCGLLLGRQDEGCVRVERVVQAKNLNTSRAHDRYELDPGDFVRADLEAREAGLEIVGIWHSHPDHPAEPSETDRLAAWEGYSYLIVSVTAQGVTAWRSWRLADQAFSEEEISFP